MTLSCQVTSLELSKRLKELGVKQESLFWWVHHWTSPVPPTREATMVWDIFQKDEDDKVNEHVSAFTVAELGEMLPNFLYSFKNGAGKWFTDVKAKIEKIEFPEYADTEADARAKMLIHLLEQGSITAEGL